jgi:WD40 repeat protein
MLFTPAASPTPASYSLSTTNASEIVQLASWGKGTPYATAWSPDGSRLAVAAATGVYLYDARTLKQQPYLYTGESLSRVTFSPDGQTLAGGGRRIWLWEAGSGKKIGVLEDAAPLSMQRRITALAFSPTGGRLAAIGLEDYGGDPPTTLTIWRIKNLEKSFAKEMSCGYGGNLAFSPDGQTLVLSECGWLYLADAATGEAGETVYQPSRRQTPSPNPTSNSIMEIAFSPPAIKDKVGDIITPKLDTLQYYHGVQLSSNGKTVLVYGIWDEQKKTYYSELWDIESEEKLATLENIGECDQPSLSPDGKWLAAINGDIQIWEVETGKLAHSIPWEGTVKNLTFAPLALPGSTARTLLVAGDGRGQILLIDPDSRQVVRAIQVDAEPLIAIAVRPDGKLIAVGAMHDNWARVMLVEVASGKLVATFKAGQFDFEEGRKIQALAFSRDGQVVASLAEDGTLQAWKVANGQDVPNPSAQAWYDANNLGATPTGHLLGLKYANSALQVNDLYSGETLALKGDENPLELCQSGIVRTSVSPDGRYMAVGCEGWDILLYDLVAQKQIYALSGHTSLRTEGWSGNITQLDFSPYGNLLASSSWDATVRLWDAAQGSLLLTLAEHTCCIYDIAFSPDGRYLASASGDGTLRLWGIHFVP